MTRPSNYLRALMLLCLLSVMLPGAAPARAAALTVVPANVSIGAGYDGVTLKISGTVPAGSDVVLRFTGAPAELHLRQKGKVFGLLWMNRDVVTFKNVPGVCLIQSSRPLDEFGPVAAALGLEKWRESVQVEDDHADPTIDGPRELLHLKMREGLFRQSAGGLSFGPATDGVQTFSAAFQVPSALSPGAYQLEAIAVKDGAVCARMSTPVKAELIGIPAWLSALAHAHGAIYGVLATVIAILAGLLIGLIFQGKGGGH